MAQRNSINQKYPFSNMPSGKPKRIPCPGGCDHGYYYYWGTQTCSVCHGTMRDFNSDLFAEPCRHCENGQVKKSRTKCNTCSGAGFIFLQ